MSVFTGGIYAKDLTDVIGIGVTLNPDGSISAVTGPTWGRVTADPNGVVSANVGSLRSQTDGTLWINTDGAMAWAVVGGGGASGWNLLDDVSGVWGTAAPYQATSVYLSASRIWQLSTGDVTAAVSTPGAGLRMLTGAVTITGAVAGDDSGAVIMGTGSTDCTDAGGTGGDSGSVTIGTGNANSTLGTSGNSGSLLFATGASADGDSGNITVQTGLATGTRGQFHIDARATTTDGVVGGTARVVGGRAHVALADSAALTNSAALTAFGGAYPVPANTLKEGSTLRVHAVVRVTAQAGATNLTVHGRVGAVAVVTSGVIAAPGANTTVVLDFWITTRAAPGAAVDTVGGGTIMETATPGASLAATLANGTTFATDGALSIDIAAQWSAADASSCYLESFFVDIL